MTASLTEEARGRASSCQLLGRLGPFFVSVWLRPTADDHGLPAGSGRSCLTVAEAAQLPFCRGFAGAGHSIPWCLAGAGVGGVGGLVVVLVGSLLGWAVPHAGLLPQPAGSPSSVWWCWEGSTAADRWRPVSHSILVALAHIAGQLVVARLLVPHDGVFYLRPSLPWLPAWSGQRADAARLLRKSCAAPQRRRRRERARIRETRRVCRVASRPPGRDGRRRRW